MKLYSKVEAAELLNISVRSLEQRMHDGMPFQKLPAIGPRGYRVFFTLDDLALPESTEPAEPVTVPVVPVVAAPVAEPEPQPALTPDEQFAADFLAGKVPDSLGNFHNQATVALVNITEREKADLKAEANKRKSGWGGNGYHYSDPRSREIQPEPDTRSDKAIAREVATAWQRGESR